MKEGEILKLFEFGIDFVTPYDLYQTFITLVTARVSGPTQILNKIKEVTMLFIKIAMQKEEFTILSAGQLVVVCFFIACTLISLDTKIASSSEIQFYLSDFK
jgi:hypothetical protein